MSPYEQHPDLAKLSLGKPTTYPIEYGPGLLQSVPRRLNREPMGIVDPLPFQGEDVWYGYEASWLNSRGKPVIALMKCQVPCTSTNLIESKSFKLYLNSLNQTRFATHQDVVKTLVKDLSDCAAGQVRVCLFRPDELDEFMPTALPGLCIDDQDIDIDQYELDSSLLSSAFDPTRHVEEILHSHLLKSNCLITGQPDWASLIISYRGCQIRREPLLRYIVSFRQHHEFHEQCVERMFTDLMRYGDFDALSVQACYTRRGGLDIMPFRSTETATAPRWRSNRQ
ncbi:NADPH-dependent 7-cyano-7-deazaguanine reductase QueF [Candidatus Entotheonella serta]|nr:NADPH-dependent 7-cyano-7-deazaguanine reductase QueF [Candidatus Entotheonella serta]